MARLVLFAIAGIVACREPTKDMTTCCQILELRQYTLKPGARDTLIEIFDREFVEPQEALGMRIVGQFRDLDRADRFVWVRGFADMIARAHALEAFYTGPVWKAHRDAANATMLDSDNVLLLRSVRPFGLTGTRDGPPPSRTLYATIVYFDERPTEDVLASIAPSALAVFTTEYSPNTFPALPVRTGENVVVVFGDRPYPHSNRTETLRLSPTERSLLR